MWHLNDINLTLCGEKFTVCDIQNLELEPFEMQCLSCCQVLCYKGAISRQESCTQTVHTTQFDKMIDEPFPKFYILI